MAEEPEGREMLRIRAMYNERLCITNRERVRDNEMEVKRQFEGFASPMLVSNCVIEDPLVNHMSYPHSDPTLRQPTL